MSDDKKYYYMRLKENFFDSEEIKLLESMPDGYLYSNILLKLYLSSLKNNGRLMFNDVIPYNAQMIATITRHQTGTVEKALKIYQDMGLIEVLDNGAIYMLNIQELIGQSGSEADRKRLYRKRIEEEKKALLNHNEPQQLDDRTNVPTNVGNSSDKHPPEIEIELDLNKKNIYSLADAVIEYLNKTIGSHYKPRTRKTVELIRARHNEGFELEDFELVISKKASEWIGTDMEKFLRPETLFSPKFEGYLNQNIRKEETELERKLRMIEES